MAQAHESSFQLHSFKDKITDAVVQFQLLLLQNSLFLWIGDHEMNNLAVALKTPYDQAPSVTNVLGGDEFSSQLSSRLSARTGFVVFASCNLPQCSEQLQACIEKRALQEIKAQLAHRQPSQQQQQPAVKPAVAQ